MGKTTDIHTFQPLGRMLSRLGKSYLQLLNSRLNFLDIQRNYYALLLIELGESNITQNELAQQLETDKVSIVRIIDHLSAKGYVNRIRSSKDRRKYCLTLTDKAIAFEGMSETRKSAFYLTLNTIKNNLQKAKITGI